MYRLLLICTALHPVIRRTSSNGIVFCGYTVDGVRSGAGISSAALGELLRGERAPIMYLRLECCRLTYSNLPAIISLLRDGSVILAACETSEP